MLAEQAGRKVKWMFATLLCNTIPTWVVRPQRLILLNVLLPVPRALTALSLDAGSVARLCKAKAALLTKEQRKHGNTPTTNAFRIAL
jgi:hypothetical protein